MDTLLFLGLGTQEILIILLVILLLFGGKKEAHTSPKPGANDHFDGLVKIPCRQKKIPHCTRQYGIGNWSPG